MVTVARNERAANVASWGAEVSWLPLLGGRLAVKERWGFFSWVQ